MQFYYSVDRGTWVAPPLMGHYYVFLNIFINDKKNNLVYLAAIALMLLIYIIKNKGIKQIIDKNKRTTVFFVFLWFFVPYTIMFLVSFKVPMFIDSYLLYTSIFYYLTLASLICLININKVIKAGLIVIFLLGILSTYNAKPYNYRDIEKSVNYVKANKTDSTIVLVCPAYDYIAFTYHYNRNIFYDYKQTINLLKKDNVFLVENKAESMKVLLEHKCNQVVYFQSISEFVDPRNETFSFLEQLFETKEQRKFILIYTVTVFKNLKEKISELPKALKIK
jgi:hypothetical protein